jgi:hypothetical protein
MNKTDRKVLGETIISPNKQITLVKEARPWIDAKPGDKLRFILTVDDRVVIEKV